MNFKKFKKKFLRLCYLIVGTYIGYEAILAILKYCIKANLIIINDPALLFVLFVGAFFIFMYEDELNIKQDDDDDDDDSNNK